LPSSFENVLFFHANYYADISGFFTRNSGSKSLIFDVFHVSLPRTKHESLKSCYIASTSWNTLALPSNGLCESFNWVEWWLFLEYPHDGVWAASRDEIPETPMTRIETEKCMVSII
jgi:hypothetical protein